VHILVATAGHIDHGKTALVSAVTGMDPDRLPEEKARGITIVPGYAHAHLDDGTVLSFVDVPGHEGFLDHMIQGANGIRLVLLVVAADDGVMPQTLEHLEVARLLGATGGVVAITKTDLVDPDWLELIHADLNEVLAGSFLENAPRLTFSALRTEEHADFIQQLKEALVQTQASGGEHRMPEAGILPIDRVITVPGRGVVITGTLCRGNLEEGQRVQVHPGRASGRIRELQVHGESVQKTSSPTRVAVNVSGLNRADVTIGSTLFQDEAKLRPNTVWLGHFYNARWLNERPRFPLKGLVHMGTAFAEATIQNLTPDELSSWNTPVAVRIRLDRPLVAAPWTGFVFRGSSSAGKAGKTIGGGQLIQGGVVARRVRAGRDKAALHDLIQLDMGDRLRGLLALHHPSVLPLSELQRFGADSTDLWQEDGLSNAGIETIATPSGTWTAPEGLSSKVGNTVLKTLSAYHERRPQDPGMSLTELRTAIDKLVPPDLRDPMFEAMHEKGEIQIHQNSVQLPGFSANLPDSLQIIAQKIESRMRGQESPTPFSSQLSKELGCSDRNLLDVLSYLQRVGSLVRINEEYWLHQEVYSDFLHQIIHRMSENGQLEVQDVKTITGLSRKYLIPFLEHLDQQKITRRVNTEARVKGAKCPKLNTA